MVEDLLPDDLGISVSYPLPGTVFYEKVKDQLKQKSNWTDSDDLDLMFKNTYPKEFYKQLQRYIHKRYRRKIGQQSVKRLFLHPNRKNLKNAMALIHLIPSEQMEKRRLTRIEQSVKTML